MLDRRACQRRVYRLATLLTGDPHSAVKVIRAVVDAQPDLRRLDSAHMDRLTILRCREIEAAMIVDDRLPHHLARAVSTLPHQQREAWVLHHVYAMTERETARAMDCSVAATQLHLQGAQKHVSQALAGNGDSAAETLRRYSLSLDVPQFYFADLGRRSSRRRLRIAIAVLAVAAAAGMLMFWLGRR